MEMFKVGEIVNDKWVVLNVETKMVGKRNRHMVRVQCLHCGIISEHECYSLKTKKICTNCKQFERESMIGQRICKLTVTGISKNKSSNGTTLMKCQCECGGIIEVPISDLKRSHTKSCGCLVSDRVSPTYNHGMNGTRIYNIYRSMKNLCYNTNSERYHNYGGAGIKVCDLWLGPNGFNNFHEWAKMTGYDDSLYLCRADINMDYSPNNCYWDTESKHISYDKLITHNGGQYTLYHISKYYNIPVAIIKKYYETGTLDQMLYNYVYYNNQIFLQAMRNSNNNNQQ